MNDSITTTGQLRQFLAAALIAVKSGEMGLDEAARITKLAAQINEGFYSELKAQKIAVEIGSAVTPLGELPIG